MPTEVGYEKDVWVRLFDRPYSDSIRHFILCPFFRRFGGLTLPSDRQ